MATDLHIVEISSLTVEDRLCYLSNRSTSQFSDYNFKCPQNNTPYSHCIHGSDVSRDLPEVFIGEVAYITEPEPWELYWPCFRIPELIGEIPDTETPQFTVVTPELIALVDGALDLTDTNIYKLGNPFWDSTGQVKGEVHGWLESHMGKEITCEWW